MQYTSGSCSCGMGQFSLIPPTHNFLMPTFLRKVMAIFSSCSVVQMTYMSRTFSTCCNCTFAHGLPISVQSECLSTFLESLQRVCAVRSAVATQTKATYSLLKVERALMSISRANSSAVPMLTLQNANSIQILQHCKAPYVAPTSME